MTGNFVFFKVHTLLYDRGDSGMSACLDEGQRQFARAVCHGKLSWQQYHVTSIVKILQLSDVPAHSTESKDHDCRMHDGRAQSHHM